VLWPRPGIVGAKGIVEEGEDKELGSMGSDNLYNLQMAPYYHFSGYRLRTTATGVPQVSSCGSARVCHVAALSG
jgi:hypothetical protein